MVIREDPDSAAVLCIPQSQHAAISGQIAAAWGNELFDAPEPHAAVLEAAARHDDGMDDFDAEPELDPDTGLPRSFMRMPLDTWLGCWREGPTIVAEDNPYAGILVSLHGCRLLGYRRLEQEHEAEAAAEFLAEQEELRDEWSGEVERDPDSAPGLGRVALARNRDLIAAWDAISLALCMPRLPDGFDDVPAADGPVRIEMAATGDGELSFTGPAEVLIDPWPFADDAVEVSARGRVLEGRYEERAELQSALAAAETALIAVTLVPG